MFKYKLCFVKSLVLVLTLSVLSCGGSKRIAKEGKAQQITTYAKSFLGTSYRYGGTNSSGMDCSGLVYRSFYRYGIELPRTSKDMSKRGKKTKLRKLKIGDLLFFKTSKKWGGGINHVGLVVKADKKDIRFIHSTTSRGVLVTSLNERYWSKNFKFARRVL